MSWEEKKVGTGEKVGNLCYLFYTTGTFWLIERYLIFAVIFFSVTIAVITFVL